MEERNDPSRPREDAAPAPGLPPGPELSEEERLRAELEEADRERGQFRNLAQRVQADFLNYRRRVEEEQQEFQRGAAAQLILKLLPVLDDLERAVVQMREDTSSPNESWLEGVRLVVRKFHGVIEEAGVQRIEVAGRAFDPWEHEAVAFQETGEHPQGHILGLVREGYKLHGRVPPGRPGDGCQSAPGRHLPAAIRRTGKRSIALRQEKEE